MVGKMKATLTESEALPQSESFQQILLAILCLDFRKHISELANELNLPLLGFQTRNELVSYLEAVIRSGTSEEEKSGTVFFMGNTEHWVLSSAGNQCCHPSWIIEKSHEMSESSSQLPIALLKKNHPFLINSVSFVAQPTNKASTRLILIRWFFLQVG